MKYRHLERYRVDLTVLSPLFIGNGEELSQKEYLVTQDGKRCIIPSMGLLIDLLAEKGYMDAFEQFAAQISSPNARARTLTQFLMDQRIPVSEKEPWVLYSMPADFPGGGNTLKKCIKYPNGRAYIPGSTIKGAIRTALIAQMMDTDTSEKLLRRVETAFNLARDRWPGEEENVLRILHCDDRHPYDAVNDLLKGLEISDSAPFSENALIVCQKFDERDDGKENVMPLYRECIRPGEKTSFYITIDKAVTSVLSKEKIISALNNVYRVLTEYDRQFDLSFDGVSDPEFNGMTPVVIGGGVGFQSKSLIYHASKKANMDGRMIAQSALQKLFPEPTNGRKKGYYKPPHPDLSPAPYSIKLTKLRHQYCYMGRCGITFSEE